MRYTMLSSLHGSTGPAFAIIRSSTPGSAGSSSTLAVSDYNGLSGAGRPTWQASPIRSPQIRPALSSIVNSSRGIARLKPDERILLALRYHRDLKLDDIADLLEVPTGTVKSRLNKAHKTLRAALATEQRGGPGA